PPTWSSLRIRRASRPPRASWRLTARRGSGTSFETAADPAARTTPGSRGRRWRPPTGRGADGSARGGGVEGAPGRGGGGRARGQPVGGVVGRGGWLRGGPQGRVVHPDAFGEEAP